MDDAMDTTSLANTFPASQAPASIDNATTITSAAAAQQSSDLAATTALLRTASFLPPAGLSLTTPATAHSQHQPDATRPITSMDASASGLAVAGNDVAIAPGISDRSHKHLPNTISPHKDGPGEHLESAADPENGAGAATSDGQVAVDTDSSLLPSPELIEALSLLSQMQRTAAGGDAGIGAALGLQTNVDAGTTAAASELSVGGGGQLLVGGVETSVPQSLSACIQIIVQRPPDIKFESVNLGLQAKGFVRLPVAVGKYMFGQTPQNLVNIMLDIDSSQQWVVPASVTYKNRNAKDAHVYKLVGLSKLMRQMPGVRVTSIYAWRPNLLCILLKSPKANPAAADKGLHQEGPAKTAAAAAAAAELKHDDGAAAAMGCGSPAVIAAAAAAGQESLQASLAALHGASPISAANDSQLMMLAAQEAEDDASPAALQLAHHALSALWVQHALMQVAAVTPPPALIAQRKTMSLNKPSAPHKQHPMPGLAIANMPTRKRHKPAKPTAARSGGSPLGWDDSETSDSTVPATPSHKKRAKRETPAKSAIRSTVNGGAVTSSVKPQPAQGPGRWLKPEKCLRRNVWGGALLAGGKGLSLWSLGACLGIRCGDIITASITGHIKIELPFCTTQCTLTTVLPV